MSVREPLIGAHDTPPALAAELVRATLAGRPGRPGRAGPVLDPACGTGALLAAALRQGVPADQLYGNERDPRRARRARRELARASGGRAVRVVVRDALSDDPWPAGTYVVANPPWASFSGRQALPAEERRAARPGWPSLHGAFLERIARHVQEQRTAAGVLLPASVCELDGYAALRVCVDATVRLDGPPTLLDEDAFPGVVEPAVRLQLAPRRRQGRGSARRWSVLPPDLEELRALLADFPRLPAGSYGDPGVHSGNAAARLLVRPDEAPAHARVREGRDVHAYRLDPPRRALALDLEPSPTLRFRVGTLARYRSIPVVLRQTADRPVAALHEPAGYFRNSVLACTPPPELDPAFCVAVLNGTVAAAWHRLSFLDARQRSFPQVKVGHLRSLPFPITRRADAPDLHDEVAAHVRRLSREPASHEPAGGETASAALDERVTRAYGLSPDVERRLRAALA